MSSVLLEIKNITKSFPGVMALNDVSLNINKGEIHAIVGENGAGKSTLIKILSGVFPADRGSITLKGEELSFTSPIQAIRKGISVVHQEIKLVETLSVAENIFIGRLPLSDGTKLVNWKKLNKNARMLLDSIGCNIDEKEYVNNLSVAQQQLVEICKALSYNSEIIIMDEPSSTLTYAELEVLFNILRNLREKKITIIYISHRLEEIFEIADTVSVLRDGMHIHTGSVNELNRRKLISMMVGRELENEYPKEFAERGDPLLEVRNLNVPGKLQNINFQLYRGEVLCIAGLVGSGRTELARTIFGADKNSRNTGEILIGGKKVNIGCVQDAMKNGIALIPEDRKNQGLVLLMSIKENISMTNIKSILTRGFLSKKKERRLANELMDVLRIQAPNENFVVRNLSGGNQQKVVIAKWLAANADILILDEPTRGVDVGAKAEIYKLLNSFVASGKGVIMISSDMPEVIGMCDRVLVFRDGTITGEFTREEVTQEKLLDCAIK
jgi:ribose transport system ATP-binding protein